MLKIIVHDNEKEYWRKVQLSFRSWQDVDRLFEERFASCGEQEKKMLFRDAYSLKALHELFGGYEREGDFGVRGDSCLWHTPELTCIGFLAKGLKMVLLVCDAASGHPESICCEADFSLWYEGWKWIHDTIRETVEVHVPRELMQNCCQFCFMYEMPVFCHGKQYSDEDLFLLTEELNCFTPDREQESYKFFSNDFEQIVFQDAPPPFTPEQFADFFPEDSREDLIQALHGYSVTVKTPFLPMASGLKYPVFYGMIQKGGHWNAQSFRVVKYPELQEAVTDLAGQMIPGTDIDSALILCCDGTPEETAADYAKYTTWGIEINRLKKEIVLMDKYQAVPAFHELVKKLPENWKI